jgi:putative nucleotidyltransferase with HDIG domain
MEATLRIVRTAHQFLPKPTDAAMLRETIERAVALHTLVRDDDIRKAIGGIDVLPALPAVYMALSEALALEEPDLEAISRLVERDTAIGAKVLQLVNSAFFGLPKRVASIRDAVGYIGINALKNLVLIVGAFRALAPEEEPPGFSAEREQQRAASTAKLARTMLPGSERLGEDAFLAGLLHDIGKLLLAVRLPDSFARTLAASHRDQRPLQDVEYEMLGFSHAEAGAYLLALWGLPYSVVEAVAHHHKPSRVASSTFDLVTAVHVASCLLDESVDSDSASTLDGPHLSRLGLKDRLSSWKELANLAAAHPW